MGIDSYSFWCANVRWWFINSAQIERSDLLTKFIDLQNNFLSREAVPWSNREPTKKHESFSSAEYF